MDIDRDFHNKYTGQTPLHIFNSLIKKLQNIHNEIDKEKKNRTNKKIRDMSISIRRMKQQIKSTRDPTEKREINNRLEELQRSLSSEIESREQAAQMRIKNFYKTGTFTSFAGIGPFISVFSKYETVDNKGNERKVVGCT